jgi:hypothetical protein
MCAYEVIDPRSSRPLQNRRNRRGAVGEMLAALVLVVRAASPSFFRFWINALPIGDFSVLEFTRSLGGFCSVDGLPSSQALGPLFFSSK